MYKFRIDKFQLEDNSKPYIIGEVSSNHKNKLSTVLRLISEIKKAGANVVKLQTYPEDTMTINSKRKEFMIQDCLWKIILFTTSTKVQKLLKCGKKNGITCFSTPFDENAVNF